MIFDAGIFPLKLGTANVPSLIINPYDFISLIRYQESYIDNNELMNYLNDLNDLILDDSNVTKLQLIDAEWASILKKAISMVEADTTFTVSTECPYDKVVNSQKISVNDLTLKKDLKFPKKIKALNGNIYPVEMPTVEYIKYVITSFLKLSNIRKLRVIKLIALFPTFRVQPNEIIDFVTHAKDDDLRLLYYLEDLFYNFAVPKTVKCTKCNTEYTLNPNQFFRFFLVDLFRNGRFASDKIIF